MIAYALGADPHLPELQGKEAATQRGERPSRLAPDRHPDNWHAEHIAEMAARDADDRQQDFYDGDGPDFD